MTKLVIPMLKEDLKEYQVEILKDMYWDYAGTIENLEMLDSVKGYTCKTDDNPIKKILAVKWIMKNGQCLVIDGVLVDSFSASAIDAVYKVLMKKQNTKLFYKIFNHKITTIANHCLKCCS